MTEAFYIATTGRPGPVLIDLPKDVTSAPCTAPFVDEVNLPGYTRARPRRDPTLLKKTAALLSKAKRPVLYVGHGAVISGAGQAILPARREAAGAGRQHAARQGRVRRGQAAAPRHAGHARHRLRQQGGHRLRPHHGHRRALGRPHHRQARPSSARTRPRSTSTSIRAEFNKIIRPDVSPGRRRPAGDRGPAAAGRQVRHRRVAEADRRLAQAVSRSSTPKQGGLRAQHVLDRLDKLGGRDCHHHHRRRPAPDVGGAVLPAPPRTATGCRPAAPARWASASRRRSARSSPTRTRRSGRSSATAASR